MEMQMRSSTFRLGSVIWLADRSWLRRGKEGEGRRRAREKGREGKDRVPLHHQLECWRRTKDSPYHLISLKCPAVHLASSAHP